MIKTISTRISHKHDIEANWLKATNFKPLPGELIIYDTDSTHNYPRFKIGDGTTVVSSLPFMHTVRTGGDVTVDSNGNITVKDDSHNHIISNVDGLQNKLESVDAAIAALDAGKSDSGHTHNYAGSSSAGGAATSANKLNTDAGSATNPVYFSNGVPVKTTYTLGKSVPSDAKFTDTTYSTATTSTAGLMSTTDKKRVDAFAGSYSLGSMNNKTIADLQTALDTWLNSYSAIPNATATFSGADDWVAGWNSGNTASVISAGGTWTVTIIAQYSTKAYTQLRFSYYSDEKVVYVHRSNGTWGTAHQAAFKDDLPSAAGSSLGLVKSGGDVTISNGVITVSDDSHNHTIANVDNLQTTIDTINNELDGSIKSLSVSGKTITYTKNDGTTGTITTQDTNNDVSVKQTASTTSNYRALLMGTSHDASMANLGTEETGQAYKSIQIAACPSTGEIVATKFTGALNGNAATATKLATARKINGVSFDGTSNITVYSPHECAVNAATLSTAGWYRIASISSLGTCGELEWSLGRNYNNTNSEAYQLLVSMAHETCNFTQINSKVNSAGITKVRLVLASDNPERSVAYLEIYYALSVANSVYSYIRDMHFATSSWTNVAFTSGSIPSGYTSIEFTLSSNPIKASTFEGALSGNATTATTATKLGTDAGSATQPVYFSGGKPVATTYTLGASVPSGAKFTDTTYSAATQSAAGLMSAADKKKLDGIASGATANTGDITGVTAGAGLGGGGTSGTVTLTNSGVRSITQDSTDGHKLTINTGGTSTTITIPDNNTTYSAATQSAQGLMSAADKKKLDGIATGANNYTYTLPSATSSTLGGVKVGSNITVSSGTISLTKSNVTTALGYTPPSSDTNTTYTIAAGDSNGQIKVTPSSGSAYNVSVKGLGSLAYKSSLSASDVGAATTASVNTLSSKVTDHETRLATIESSIVTVHSGTEAAMTANVGSDGDVYLVTE